MADPRVEKVAQLLVNYSVGVRTVTVFSLVAMLSPSRY